MKRWTICRWSSKGAIFLTNMRLIFVAKDAHAESGASFRPQRCCFTAYRLICVVDTALPRRLGSVRTPPRLYHSRQVQTARLWMQQPSRSANFLSPFRSLRHALRSKLWKPPPLSDHLCCKQESAGQLCKEEDRQVLSLRTTLQSTSKKVEWERFCLSTSISWSM